MCDLPPEPQPQMANYAPLGKQPRKRKEPFTPEEDQIIRNLVGEFGVNCWPKVAESLPGRNTRQCRERWMLYLSPDVRNDPWSEEEDMKLMNLYTVIGGKWSLIAKSFPNRTGNNIKNRVKLCMRRSQKLARTQEMKRLPVDSFTHERVDPNIVIPQIPIQIPALEIHPDADTHVLPQA